MAFRMFGRTIHKIGVVGSGNIGPDIALHFSQSLYSDDVPVVIVDIVQTALDRGWKRARSKMAKASEKGVFKQKDAEAILRGMCFTTDYEALADADLIVEAAFERMDVKRKIFEQCQAVCARTAIFASNSSHMVPEDIFQEIEDKSRSLVVHYFFPAERNMLVEVVPGKETDAGLVDFLMRFYEHIGKAPIRVKSRYGYAVDPIFEGLFLAAALAVEQGLASIRQTDAIASRTLGMGVGPFTAHNLAGGNPITRHGLSGMNSRIMPWYRSPQLLENQLKTGRPWETAAKGENVQYDPETEGAVSRRIMGACFGMACEIVESDIANIGDLEMALEIGLVMTPPFRLMNRIGVKKALELVEAYGRENPGFKIPQILVKQSAMDKPWEIPVVLKEERDHFAIVKIRRPKVLNALNEEVFRQLEEAFEDIRKDDRILGAVLTGFGTRAFVSGADIGMLAALKTPAEAEALCLRTDRALNLIENLGKPVVCAMNGLAFGGGNEIAMACTARIARKGLKIFVAHPEPRLGLISGNGGTQRLPRLVGMEHAWSILRNAGPISTARAKEIGLVHDEVEGEPVQAALDLLRGILRKEVLLPSIEKGPLPIPKELPDVDIGHLSRRIDSLLCRAILEGAKTTLEEGLILEARIFGECLLTEDKKIGIDNFIKNGPRVNAPFVHR